MVLMDLQGGTPAVQAAEPMVAWQALEQPPEVEGAVPARQALWAQAAVEAAAPMVQRI